MRTTILYAWAMNYEPRGSQVPELVAVPGAVSDVPTDPVLLRQHVAQVVAASSSATAATSALASAAKRARPALVAAAPPGGEAVFLAMALVGP